MYKSWYSRFRVSSLVCALHTAITREIVALELRNLTSHTKHVRVINEPAPGCYTWSIAVLNEPPYCIVAPAPKTFAVI